MRFQARLIGLGLVAALAGCGAKPPASVKGGECKAFHRAAIEVCGLTEADQATIDDVIESGVAACKWRRPAARTPSCEDLRAEIEEIRRIAVAPAPAPPAVKPGLLARLKAKLKKQKPAP